ncbi:hypothetical protein J0A71_06g14010 [Encephalitozoon cuniculi]|nr:hypothetical protein J0A71_06g14010 [Encephalitozoon cuniculi]
MKSNELPGFDEHPEPIYELIESMGASNAMPRKELIEAILGSKEFKDYGSLTNQKDDELHSSKMAPTPGDRNV